MANRLGTSQNRGHRGALPKSVNHGLFKTVKNQVAKDRGAAPLPPAHKRTKDGVLIARPVKGSLTGQLTAG